MISSVPDSANGFTGDDGGDRVFLVVDVKIKSRFSRVGSTDDSGKILTEIFGDNDGGVIIASIDAL